MEAPKPASPCCAIRTCASGAQGALADRIGIQPAFVLPLLCYPYIVFYGLRGSRVKALPAVR